MSDRGKTTWSRRKIAKKKKRKKMRMEIGGDGWSYWITLFHEIRYSHCTTVVHVIVRNHVRRALFQTVLIITDWWRRGRIRIWQCHQYCHLFEFLTHKFVLYEDLCGGEKRVEESSVAGWRDNSDIGRGRGSRWLVGHTCAHTRTNTHTYTHTGRNSIATGREPQPCWINRSEFAARTLNYWPFTRTGEQPSAKRGT